MPAQQPHVMMDILEEHFEELEFLWQQRQEALRSPEYTLPEVAELEERIEAHVDGLVLAGAAAIPILEAGLGEDDPLIVASAAYVLLRLDRDDAFDMVIAALLEAEGPRLDGLREALCLGPIGRIESRLRDAALSATVAIGAAAAESLAFHSRLDSKFARVGEFLKDADPQVRCGGWRISAMLETI
jgi:uncharacterized protein (TIGR02270 family)